MNMVRMVAILTAALFCTSAFARAPMKPVDGKATVATKSLYKKLAAYGGKRQILFGGHSPNVMGCGFDALKDGAGVDRCDIKSSVGDYPAVFSYDFTNGFSALLPFVKRAASLGGIVTICYHIDSPYGDSRWGHITDPSRRDVSKVLPGGEKHGYLLAQLDSIASFAQRAIHNGERIPIIFRPWHEHTGDWFWWGTEGCTGEEFVALWRFTVGYLRDVKGVHNFLYAYSPSRPSDFGGYATRNPGAEWFDIAGFDCYGTADFRDKIVANAKETVGYAKKHGKVAAITEFGYRKGLNNCTDPEWFTSSFLLPLSDSDLLEGLSYAATWHNVSRSSWWAPLPGGLQHADFVRFSRDKRVVFLKGSK
ncbi:mannan endo-1,4-beta-mannosidase [Bacteroidia bacterium]|nr:mannan endo-1,4-beta-mannosidase [Bacteroidia bacterium]